MCTLLAVNNMITVYIHCYNFRCVDTFYYGKIQRDSSHNENFLYYLLYCCYRALSNLFVLSFVYMLTMAPPCRGGHVRYEFMPDVMFIYLSTNH